MLYNENVHSKLIMNVPYHTINLQSMHIPNKMFLTTSIPVATLYSPRKHQQTKDAYRT